MSEAQQPRRFVNSSQLGALRELVAATRFLRDTLEGAIQVRVVLDSNAIIRDLIWLTQARIKQEAKTSIQELIEAQTLVAYAPRSAQDEVERHIPAVARKRQISEDQLRRTWTEYQASIVFCEIEVKTPAASTRDPADLSFIALAEIVGASGIITRDKDIAAMGGRVLHFDCIIHLRDYSRAKTIELTFRLSGVTLAAVGVAAIRGIWVATQSLVASVSRLPTWLRLVLIITAAVVLLNPTTRRALFSRAASLNRAMGRGAAFFQQPVSELLIEFLQAQKLVDKTLCEVKRLLPPHKAPLRTHVYAVCLAANIPLPITMIERRVLAAGYRTRNKKFSYYLQQVLKSDERLSMNAEGRWFVVERTTGRLKQTSMKPDTCDGA